MNEKLKAMSDKELIDWRNYLLEVAAAQRGRRQKALAFYKLATAEMLRRGL